MKLWQGLACRRLVKTGASKYVKLYKYTYKVYTYQCRRLVKTGASKADLASMSDPVTHQTHPSILPQPLARLSS